jgi:hypothetical protein
MCAVQLDPARIASLLEARAREFALPLGPEETGRVLEAGDAIAVVVSEETGTISLVVGGAITRHLDGGVLRQRLSQLMGPPQRGFGRARSKTAAATSTVVK